MNVFKLAFCAILSVGLATPLVSVAHAQDAMMKKNEMKKGGMMHKHEMKKKHGMMKGDAMQKDQSEQ